MTLLQFGTGLMVALSLTAAASALLAQRLRWSLPRRKAWLALFSGCIVVLLFLAFGLGQMTVARISGTRPRLTREETAQLNAIGTGDLVEMASFGLLFGAPAILAGFLGLRRSQASRSPRI